MAGKILVKNTASRKHLRLYRRELKKFTVGGFLKVGDKKIPYGKTATLDGRFINQANYLSNLGVLEILDRGGNMSKNTNFSVAGPAPTPIVNSPPPKELGEEVNEFSDFVIISSSEEIFDEEPKSKKPKKSKKTKTEKTEKTESEKTKPEKTEQEKPQEMEEEPEKIEEKQPDQETKEPELETQTSETEKIEDLEPQEASEKESYNNYESMPDEKYSYKKPTTKKSSTKTSTKKSSTKKSPGRPRKYPRPEDKVEKEDSNDQDSGGSTGI